MNRPQKWGEPLERHHLSCTKAQWKAFKKAAKRNKTTPNGLFQMICETKILDGIEE